MVFISHWPLDRSVLHINPCRTVPLGVPQWIRCQQTRPCALSNGIYHNWNSYPILYQLFHLCQFCPRVNFALHWFPSSWAICSNLCLITPSLIDEVLWPPLVVQWTLQRWWCCKIWRLWPLVSALSETQSLPCGLWSMLSVVNRDGFRRLSKVNQWESKSYWCSAVLLFMEA